MAGLLRTWRAVLGERWSSEGGYRELLGIALPLVISTSTWQIQHFVDRMFLSWYSVDALAAAMPAGMLNFSVMCLFLGVAGYTSVFVAQYFGAKRHARIGPAMWQGVYVALAGGAVMAAFAPAAVWIFDVIGHAPEVRRYEVEYFRILAMGSGPALVASAVSGLFSGLGRPWPVTWSNIVATAMNLVLDAILIFGCLGAPRMGVKGAAIATVISGAVSLLAYLPWMARPLFRRRYRVFSGWRFDRELFARLLRYGLPGGAQFFIDMASFTTFMLLVGTLGPAPLAASNIALNINGLAFMPMIGLGIAVSTLVGQYLGANREAMAERSVYSAFHLSTFYMCLAGVLFVALPGILIWPYEAGSDPAAFAEVRRLTIILLRFVAFYCLFDSLNIVFSSALRGAGDTRFVMVMLMVVAVVGLVAPSFAVLHVFHGGLAAMWSVATAYVVILGFSFLSRFRQGKWKGMRVIEAGPPDVEEAVGE
ncbi:MAG TPA: MATE family efflux transporter [Candidatus Brocadiia bacterium]|nr:MATE family efflux transporter [Candidatus Brocadiia bacterium]